jgi:hypothetical protein
MQQHIEEPPRKKRAKFRELATQAGIKVASRFFEAEQLYFAFAEASQEAARRPDRKTNLGQISTKLVGSPEVNRSPYSKHLTWFPLVGGLSPTRSCTRVATAG